MDTTAAPSLTDQVRRLLEAVKGELRAEGWRGWLAVPMTLLMWVRTRRERREAEAAGKLFVGMLEQLLMLLRHFQWRTPLWYLLRFRSSSPPECRCLHLYYRLVSLRLIH